jgi:hypothetical protein
MPAVLVSLLAKGTGLRTLLGLCPDAAIIPAEDLCCRGVFGGWGAAGLSAPRDGAMADPTSAEGCHLT